MKNRALGDTIISLGTLKFLKNILPQTEIFYLVPDWTEALFQQVSFPAAKIIGIKMQTPGDWFSTYRLLRKLKPDAILELSQAGRTGMFFDMYSSLHRVPYFFHNHHSKVGSVRDQGVQKAIIQRDLDAAWTYFGWLQKVPIPNYLDYPPSLGLIERMKVKRVILGVVATRETKMYPLEKYAEIANKIRAHDFKIEIVAPLSNSPEDKVIADKIAALKAPIQTVVKPLAELPMYFKESMIYIGNDTGLKHLAVAMDLPTVTLFGPEPPIEWHPYDKKRHPYFFRHPLPCRYETGKTYCPLSKCSSMICLKDIPADSIWEKAKELLFDSSTTAEPQTQIKKSFLDGSSRPSADPIEPGMGGRTLSADLSMGKPEAPKTISMPIELEPEMERTDISKLQSTNADAFDLGPTTGITQVKKRDEDPDDDGEKTTIL